MRSLRKLAYAVAWLGLAYTILTQVRERPSLGGWAVDVGYGLGIILLATLGIITVVLSVNRISVLPGYVRWIAAGAVVLTFAALDQFWLHNLLAGQ